MASKQIDIEQWPHPLASKKGTLLDAALAAGVPYPHECRSGECGHCKTQLLQGEVRQAPSLAEALSQDERARDLILACRSYPKTDVRVRWLENSADALPCTPNRQVARVHKVQRDTRTVTRLWLTLSDHPMRFVAGQYARLRFGDLPVRSYSMANMPESALLEFHIAHLEGGRVSSHVMKQLREGDSVHLEGPFGDAYLREAYLQPTQTSPLVAVAGGTGLAPILSIVRSALHERPETRICLYFAARDNCDIYAEEELRSLAKAHDGLDVHIVLSRSTQASSHRGGSILEVLDEDFDSLTNACLYTAGSPRLVNAVKEWALVKGISSQALHCDAFWSPQETRPRKRKTLTQRLSGLFRS